MNLIDRRENDLLLKAQCEWLAMSHNFQQVRNFHVFGLIHVTDLLSCENFRSVKSNFQVVQSMEKIGFKWNNSLSVKSGEPEGKINCLVKDFLC